MDTNTLWNWGMKIVGAGAILWMMIAIAHGAGSAMTHALSMTTSQLPTP